jgi:hypothetical protein
MSEEIKETEYPEWPDIEQPMIEYEPDQLQEIKIDNITIKAKNIVIAA